MVCIISFKYILYVEKTKLVSLMLLAGTLAVPESAFAEITPERPSVSLSQQMGK